MPGLSASLRSLFGPIDPRSSAKVDDDLAAEFDFHLSMIQHELTEAGIPPNEAAQLARERFGDLDRIRSECRRIAFQEHAMIKNILLAASLVLLIGAGLFNMHMYETARHAMQDAQMQRAVAEQERHRAEAVSSFLLDVIASTDPVSDRVSLTVDTILQQAARGAKTPLTDDPALHEAVRDAIERTQARAQQISTP